MFPWLPPLSRSALPALTVFSWERIPNNSPALEALARQGFQQSLRHDADLCPPPRPPKGKLVPRNQADLVSSCFHVRVFPHVLPSLSLNCPHLKHGDTKRITPEDFVRI